jgi:glycosyltransferase involved in cell wall biosynthesis
LSEEKAKILLISSYSGESRVWKIARTLSEKGFSIHILEWDRKANLPRMAFSHRIMVHRMKLRAPYGNRLFTLFPIWFVFVAFFVLFHKFDIIQPQNLDNLLPSFLSARLRHSKIVYDLSDFYAETYVPSQSAYVKSLVAWAERVLCGLVDRIVLVDEVRLTQLGRYQGKKVAIIYNSTPDVSAEESKPLHSKGGNELTIIYAGALQRMKGITFLVQAVKDLKRVRLIMAGYGELEKDIERISKLVRNISFKGRIPHDSAIRLTSASDCVVALYDPEIRTHILASPNKFFEAIMCGKPIITNCGTHVGDLVKRFECGSTVKYGDVNALKQVLILFRDNPKLRRALGRNGRRAYESHFDWETITRRLAILYESVLKEN